MVGFKAPKNAVSVVSYLCVFLYLSISDVLKEKLAFMDDTTVMTMFTYVFSKRWFMAILPLSQLKGTRKSCDKVSQRQLCFWKKHHVSVCMYLCTP